MLSRPPCSFFFFFNDTATTEIYTLSLHDALPISPRGAAVHLARADAGQADLQLYWRPQGIRNLPTPIPVLPRVRLDRKSTRLNSSHGYISYAVFCLKKKKNNATLHG